MAVVVLATALAAQHVIWFAPAAWYLLRSPSTGVECAAIQPGMTRTEVMRLIHRRAEPAGEYTTPGGIKFPRRESCSVEFDPASDRVIRAVVQVPEYSVEF